MSTATTPKPSTPPVDRSVRLMVLGGLQIILGCLSAFAALMMASLFLGGKMPPGPTPPVSPRMMIPNVAMYLAFAVAFIWVGMGLILVRRWAWSLTLVLSWMGLVFGLSAAVMMQFLMGRQYWEAVAEQAHMPPEMIRMMWTTMTLTVIAIYVVLPGIFVVFCQPKSVRDTVYGRDPAPRWTDRCPMPVLAICLFEAFALFSCLTLGAYNWTLPLFGHVLSGPTGALAIGLFAVLLALLAWGTYRLKMLAWWGTLVVSIAGGVNSTLMLWRGDMLTMYEKMGFSAEMIDMIRKTRMLDSFQQGFLWMSLAFGAACVGYLVYIRRYFARKPEIAGVAA